jgi:hypothetical protein
LRLTLLVNMPGIKMKTEKTVGDLIWQTAISLFGVIFSVFTLPEELHAKLFKAPSGGAYAPTHWDRAWCVAVDCAFFAFLIKSIFDWIRWFRRRPPMSR